MIKVKIYGAGSIGNHLAHACRLKGWDVLVCDTDPAALERTKNQIYPGRYGQWDKKIRLVLPSELSEETFDVVIVGTPPDKHMPLALQILQTEPPKVLLIEKPLCPPSLEFCDQLYKENHKVHSKVIIGYNHVLTENTRRATDVLLREVGGEPISMNIRWIEHWGGIFGAHPWLNGPQDTYLGFSDRGGGACGEHSHAINIWQHFSCLLGKGRISEVSCMMDVVSNDSTSYDRFCSLNVRSEKGLSGNIIQDVITYPSEKTVRIQGKRGYLEWWVNKDQAHDAIKYWDGENEPQEEFIFKKRPDDFNGEIDHVADLLQGKTHDSPISLEKGLETMLIIAAAHTSNKLKKTVGIDYSAGYNLKAINPL